MPTYITEVVHLVTDVQLFKQLSNALESLGNVKQLRGILINLYSHQNKQYTEILKFECTILVASLI